MLKRYLTFCFIIIFNFPLLSQINKNGIPFIKNYSKDVYNASEQNWAICQDKRGVMYFGNNDGGVLVYNGDKWEKVKIQNNEVRSLAVDSLGFVYVGGNNEFGYLAPDIQGKQRYYSLCKNGIDTLNFGKIWKTYTKGDEVYFCSNMYIFLFKNRKFVKSIHSNEGGFFSFLVQDNLYWGNYHVGLQVAVNDTTELVNGGEFYIDKDIFVILPFTNDELFIGTIVQGCFIYNTITGESKNITSINNDFKDLSDLLINGQLYNGIQLQDGNYAFATINYGCVIINKEGRIIEQYTKENGLPDISVTDVYQNNEGILWLSSVNGISYVEYNTPFRKFDAISGIDGIITAVINFNEHLYVGTTVGLFYQKFDENKLPYFELVSDINHFVWSMTVFKIGLEKEKLLVATARNTYELINPNKVIAINNSKYTNCNVLYQSKINQNKLYVGSEFGINSVEWINGKWKCYDRYTEPKEDIKSIFEDTDGNIWAGGGLNGISKINSDSKITHYDVNSGLPYLDDNNIYNINGEILIATRAGIYYYVKEKDRFEKYNGFGEKYFLSSNQVRSINKLKENEYWIVSKDLKTNFEYLEKVTLSQDHIINIDDIPFKRLIRSSFHDINLDKNSGVWITTSDAVYHYQEKLNDDFSNNYNSIISKVEMGIDSVIFWGTYYNDTAHYYVATVQPKELTKTVEYRDNSFQFYFSTPFFPSDDIAYSSKLVGFDNKWSNWENKTDRPFTNLDEGHYIFQVKAKNIYGIESEIASYEFYIKPPWYRTLFAYFIYTVLAIFIIIIIVKIYTRRLEQEKIRLEQIVKERTEEVVKQKDELEIQRDEIADKNRSITDSIEYAKRIQNAVLPSQELAQEILPEHFILFRPRDIVSGDFYWMTKKGDNIVIIAADCTGHGVPGAFMSMLGVSFLNEIVNRHQVTSADGILNSLRTDIKKTMGQRGKEGEAKDGMDIALCIIDLVEMKMQYAGAYNPLYLYRNNELIEYKADRMPIGIYVKEKESFTNNLIDLQKGDVFYIASDGYQDQFGGEDGQKFKTKKYKELLLEIHQKPMAEQCKILNTTIDKWRGKWEQVDDIIVLGIRI